MVTMQDAIRLAKRLVRADLDALGMRDYRLSPDFKRLRTVAQEARTFLANAGERIPNGATEEDD